MADQKEPKTPQAPDVEWDKAVAERLVAEGVITKDNVSEVREDLRPTVEKSLKQGK